LDKYNSPHILTNKLPKGNAAWLEDQLRSHVEAVTKQQEKTCTYGLKRRRVASRAAPCMVEETPRVCIHAHGE